MTIPHIHPPRDNAPGRIDRVTPARLDDWPAMCRHDNVRPVLGDRDPRDPKVQAEYARFVARLGPLPLPHVREVAAAIDNAHFENDMSMVGTQRCVVIDGRAHVGKTYAALAKAFRETREVWDAQPRRTTATARSIPWAYIEVPPRAQVLSLYQAILTFCGMPLPRASGRSNATTLGAALRDLAPEVGLRGVIIDDSHGIAGTDRDFVGDILKTIVTGLPATVVIVGANMRERGIFDTVPGEQVRERAEWVHVADWPVPPPKGDVGPWGELAAYFTAACPLPDPDRRVALDSRRTLIYLATQSGQKPGTAIKWLKRAAVHAIVSGTDVDLDALKATERTP